MKKRRERGGKAMGRHQYHQRRRKKNSKKKELPRYYKKIQGLEFCDYFGCLSRAWVGCQGCGLKECEHHYRKHACFRFGKKPGGFGFRSYPKKTAECVGCGHSLSLHRKGVCFAYLCECGRKLKINKKSRAYQDYLRDRKVVKTTF